MFGFKKYRFKTDTLSARIANQKIFDTYITELSAKYIDSEFEHFGFLDGAGMAIALLAAGAILGLFIKPLISVPFLVWPLITGVVFALFIKCLLFFAKYYTIRYHMARSFFADSEEMIRQYMVSSYIDFLYHFAFAEWYVAGYSRLFFWDKLILLKKHKPKVDKLYNSMYPDYPLNFSRWRDALVAEAARLLGKYESCITWNDLSELLSPDLPRYFNPTDDPNALIQ